MREGLQTMFHRLLWNHLPASVQEADSVYFRADSRLSFLTTLTVSPTPPSLKLQSASRLLRELFLSL